MSAALTGTEAGLGWSEALDVRAAAGAGVVSEAEAQEATLDAVLETLLAGLDISLALKALKHIKVPRARFLGGSRARRKPRRRVRRKDPTLHGSIAPYWIRAPAYQRHEVLVNVWLEEKGYVKKRLKGWQSRQNPTIALLPDEHVIVGLYQEALGLHDP